MNEEYPAERQDSGPSFVRYLFEGEQKNTDILPTHRAAREKACELAADVARTGIVVLPAKLHPSAPRTPVLFQVLFTDTSVSAPGLLPSQVEHLSDPESYEEAKRRADRLIKDGFTVGAVLTEEAARERVAAGQTGHDVTAEVAEALSTLPPVPDVLFLDDPADEQVSAFEEGPEDSPDSDDPGPSEGTDTTDSDWERRGRRHQALDWALRLAEMNKSGLSLSQVAASSVVADAEVFLAFLEHPHPGSH